MTLVATQVKRRRGTNDENDAFAGAEGEITVDLTNKELRVHDGSGKTGGFRIGRRTDRTNCITEAPQDIKLELNNGTLTLKAGSKVYFPNGVGVFSIRNIPVDRTFTLATNGQYLLSVRQDTSIWGYAPSTATSGTTPPTGTGTFYNTTTNSIDYYNNGTYNERHYSFPFALITVSNGVISSIDQIFNGFGYIGSTVFVLPALKGLMPNGRNEDGSLKNTEIAVNTVQTLTPSSSLSMDVAIVLEPITRRLSYCGDPIYNEAENLTYDSTTQRQYCQIGSARLQASKIMIFKPKTVFHTVDYSDTEYIAHQVMPSKKYIDLTLGATGSAYTAPADGYFALASTFDTTGYLYMYRGSGGRYGTTLPYNANLWVDSFIPVAKGDVMVIQYNGTASVQSFKFIYAKGSK